MDVGDLDLPTMVALAGPAVVRRLLQRIGEAGHEGVKPSHGYVVQRLVDEQPTIGELARSLGITQQGASKQVADLERLGYAERVPGDRDQRVRTVRLTADGRAMLAAGRQARRELEDELVEQTGMADLAAARSVLVKLLRIVELAEPVATRTVPLPAPD